MDNLHFLQMKIVRKLTFAPGSKFSDLNEANTPSDQFSYHLRALIKQGLLRKQEDQYFLINKGKLYSTHMDTDSARIEKLPKVSVLVIPTRTTDLQTEYLIHTRAKEPYFGYSGFITGKIRYGETVEQAAVRELNEEAGVQGENFSHHFILHEMVFSREGEQLEDKFFNVVSFAGVQGDFVEKTEDGSNVWVTEAKFRQMQPLFHNEIDLLNWYLEGRTGFWEETYTIDPY